MHSLYLIGVWLHIMAAVLWVGGTLFLVIVLVPALRRPEFGTVSASLVRFTALRFRFVGWVCLVVLILTGMANLVARGIGFDELGSALFWRGSFGQTLGIKLILVIAILLISAFHDFNLGPRAAAAWSENPREPETQRLRRRAVALGRLNLLLALTVIALATMLVRGAGW